MSTTSNLITNIKTRAAIPTSQNTFTNSKFLFLADDEIGTALVPMIMKARESYFSYDKDYTISSTTYPDGYSIPTRAIGGKVQDVCLVDSNGRKASLDLTYEELVTDSDQSPTGNPAFYFKNNRIILVPEVPTGFTILRISYFIRPSSLIEVSAAAKISSINTGTGVITCESVPTTFSTSTPLDAVKGQAHFDNLDIDVTPSAVSTGSGGTITVSTTLASKLSVGDYFSPAGYSPIVQLPTEFHALLAQRVANRCMQAQGDTNGLKIGEDILAKMENGIFSIISPRAESEPKKIVNRSPLTRKF